MSPILDQASPTLLVVEDEALIRLATADYFRCHGWRVLEASNGESAQALFVSPGYIDVMFSDVQMSSERDGIVLAAWVRANHPEVAVLLTSGASKLTDVSSDICAQASTFTKPYACAAVAARIAALRN